MPEIRGTISRDDADQRPCVWCLEPTSTRAETPGRPDLGMVPLHVFCAGAIIVAYNRWNAGILTGAMADQLAAYQARLLEAGTPTAV